MVLTGGGSRRLGTDKATAVVAGRRMVDRVIAQLPEVPVVVVGPDPGIPGVVVTREDPPGGGPAAGIAAALEHVCTPWVAVIAADMPFAVPMVMALPRKADAVIPVAQGVPQPLCAWYRVDALRGLGPGVSMRAVLKTLDAQFVEVDERTVFDIDGPDDLAEAERILTIMEAMQEWVDAVRTELGLDVDVDVQLILDVAKDAAHGVQRPAAPVSTYLLGLAVAGGADPKQAAAAIGRLAQEWSTDA